MKLEKKWTHKNRSENQPTKLPACQGVAATFCMYYSKSCIIYFWIVWIGILTLGSISLDTSILCIHVSEIFISVLTLKTNIKKSTYKMWHGYGFYSFFFLNIDQMFLNSRVKIPTVEQTMAAFVHLTLVSVLSFLGGRPNPSSTLALFAG